jgi:RHS repeat-associated protein
MKPETFYPFNTMNSLSKFFSKCVGRHAAVAILLVAGAVSAGATAMQTYLDSCSYAATTGGSISGWAKIASTLNCSDNVWENHASSSISWTVGVTGTGGHPITSSDVDKMTASLTWAAGDYSSAQGFTFNCTNTALGYDKNGTVSVSSDCTATAGCGSAPVTIYNTASIMNAVFVSSGTNYANWTMTKGDGAQSIKFRILRGDTVNTRTVTYTVGGTAVSGTDFTVSPALSGSVTINAGSSNADFTISISGSSSLVTTKTLILTLQSGYYQIGNATTTLLIGQDVPVISVTAPSAYDSQNNYYQGQFTLTRSGELTNAVTTSLTVGGTATAGTDYTALPTSVTFAANQTSTNLFISALNANLALAKTVVLSLVTNSTYFPGLTTNATVTILPNGSTTNSVASPTGMYWRGSGSDPTYWSQVVPLEYETGTVYSNVNGNCSTLYSGLTSWSSPTLYHYNAAGASPQSNPANRIAFNNPIVAFGERVGGTPLYFSQPYSFGIYGGDTILSNQPVIVQAYYRTNFQLAGTVSIYPPSVSSTNAWKTYMTNGFQVITNAYGLTTVLADAMGLNWGENSRGAYVLTHTANNQATNYYYVVGVSGNPADSSNPMVINGSGQLSPSLLYSLEFEQRPPWRSVFLDQPHFNGSPLPPFYAGDTLAEMLTNTPPVTNVVSIAPSAATNLDNSPELRRHPVLDSFVASMGNDPIALANYVINQIGLTDPVDYNDNGNVAENSINPGGVTRGALGTFMEKQGSPAEQCALLVYLLRQAGVPAVYEFAPHNGLQILDARLSQMLQFQVHGDINQAGQLYTTNTMIPVNYPWVAAYIGTNWIHIFPWLKDYRISEGLNLFDEMPTNYSNAYGWVHDYIYGNTNLLSLAVNGDNTPRVIFPRYLQQTLLQNHPGVSVDDIGVKIINRQHYYARWQDFPTPTWVTNTSTSLENLSSSTLTNIFDTMSVEVYSQDDPTKDIKTGDMRLVDLHNRQFYINQFVTNGNVQLNLVLMPFRTNVVTQFAYSNDTNLLSKEVLSLTFDANDQQLQVRFKYHRHRAITPAYAIDPWSVFLGLNGFNEIDVECPLLVGDQAAICLNYGQVTPEMLNVHAADLWQMQKLLNASPGQAGNMSPDVYEGATMYLAGLSYYKKIGDFDQVNQHLQKFTKLSSFAVGLSKIIPARDSYGSLTNGTDPVLPCVDMFFYGAMLAGNGTLHPDSGQNYTMAGLNYNLMQVTDGSAEEHQVINNFYRQTNAVSTVRLLQLAQNGAGIVALTPYNYVAQGTTNYQGKPLQSWDAGLWQSVVSAFQSAPSYGFVTGYITPGPMTNAAYKGMGVLLLEPNICLALITPHSMNGGFAGQPLPANTVAAANTPNYNLSDNNNDYSIALNQPANNTTTVPDEIPLYDAPTAASQTGNYAVDPFTTTWAADVSSQLGTTAGTSSSALSTDILASEQNGSLGMPNDPSQAGGQVGDPVNNITGEFYVSETDLWLPGAMSLALHRNYSSHNLADNQFGRGWKLNIMPYLSLSKKSTNIYAADMDGAVLAYVQQSVPAYVSAVSLNNHGSNYKAGDVLTVVGGTGTAAQIHVDSIVPVVGWIQNYSLLSSGQYTTLPSTPNTPTGGSGSGATFDVTTAGTIWMPTLAANPQLNNNTVAGVGGLANRLRDYITRSVNGSLTNYTLYGADGSVRLFQFMKFDSGSITNERPYLQQWTDNRGNYYTFSYDANSSDANFGQMQRIQCSNGNFLGFDYDVYGHMVDAYTGDGRWMYYDYDDFGDLVTVTLPDNATRSYQYLHSTQSVTNGGVVTKLPYSTHLLIEEDKPDGRALVNAYDGQRRVTNQLSTAGLDLNPIRTATFIYSNNYVFTNSWTNTISGYTLIVDGNNHTNRYDYTNNLITQITDPLGQTIQQVWFTTNTTAPGYYPRSVSQRTNKRGLVTQYQYDSNGNVTNTIATGDLSGDGITSQTATNTASYNTNNLPVQMTDPAGNGVVTVYDPVFTFLPQQTIRYAGATPISTNYTLYGNATNVVINGNITQTNQAFGLPIRQIRAYSSTDAATNDFVCDGHGFITQSTRYSGTGDPDVINTYFYNERGQRVVQADALGAFTFHDYDALDRPTETENFDEFGNALSWSFNYYNDNGELTWTDGPRYNPEDYVFYDYDGMGRRSTEIHWRSEAKSDGSGVEAPTGYNLYSQSFFQYDALGNLTLAVDPRGAMTTNTWDALCRLTQKKHLDVDGLTVLSAEGFGYEPGGQVQAYTNALGGVTTTLYTDTGKPEYRATPEGATNAWRYYLDGRVKREIQGNGAYWQTTYDDANRITTHIFYSASGSPLATNSTQLDRRGNVIRSVDAGNNAFTTTFDSLDRTKSAAGPAIVTVSAKEDITGTIIGYTTNVLQQASTNFYAAAGRAVTNANAIGEKTITTLDAIGRTTSVKILSATGSLVRERYLAYSADHNRVTLTDGSGANAVVSTSYTDNDGHTLLAIGYPASGTTEFTLNQYDLAGNLAASQHDSSSNGTVTTWTTTSLVYDGLNRPIGKFDRDGALTTYAYNPLGDVTNRTMPGNLQWQASYNNAGQMMQERNVGGGSATRTNAYVYYSGGSPFAGLLQTKSDGRGVTCTYAYDDWLRPTNAAYAGSLPEQNLTTAYQYESRGFVTNITEQFASTNTGTPTVIQRAYDPYGQLANESVNGGTFGYGGNQTWDAAGRRTQLTIGGAGYGFGWRADGNLVSASDPTGSGSYAFDTAGLLTNRAVGLRTTSILARDGEGRPGTITTTVNGVTKLTESLAWSGDGLLASHTLVRSDFTDSRSYAYANLSRRLTQEQLNLNGSTSWTNNFAYDSGVAAGPGALTQAGGTSSQWNGIPDTFSRISTATNNVISYAAYGHVNGQSTLSAWLDGQPVSVTGVGTNAMQWRSALELSAGTHQLKLAALHPSGQFTALATNTFTNNIAYQTTGDTFDNAGNITQRVWRNPNGTTNKIQTLSWDARGRLHSVTERDASNSGYNWTAVYDAFSRRLSTTAILVSNGVVAAPSSPVVINQYYDPLYEFLELGVAHDGKTEWKLYGPDLNGQYGGLNGTGGFEGFSPYLNIFTPVISDARGNILGEVTNGVVTWFASRPTGYGAVPGYRPMTLGSGTDLAQASAWRGRWADITLNYHVGMREYNPVAGGWLSHDPVWNGRDPNCYSFAGGDPVNYFDADGRCPGQNQNSNPAQPSQGSGMYLSTFMGDISYDDWGGTTIDTGGMHFYMMPESEYNYLIWQKPLEDEIINGLNVALDSVLNTSQRNQASYEFTHADFGSVLGVTTWAVAGVSYVANTVDMVGNFIPGKAAIEDVVKVGIKDVTKGFTEDVAKSELNFVKDEIPTINGHKPMNSGYAGQTHPSGVEFNDQGFPDFSPHSKAEVELDNLTGNYPKDAAMANEAAGFEKTPAGYVWHHVEDSQTMQLIPQDIHKAARHTGGSAIIRNGGFDQ